MAGEDIIMLSQKDLKRLHVIEKVREGTVKQVSAAQTLLLSTRQIRRIVSRISKEGSQGVVHRSRGKPSNRRYSDTVKSRSIALYRQRYLGFGPTLAAEKLSESHGIEITDETLRISILKAILKKAVDWNMVEEEVLKRTRRVKMLTENNKRLRYISREDCQSLINFCEPHLRPILITALNTGMRKEEILSLKLDQVDLKHGFILLDRTKNGERREIPINQTLRSALQSITRLLDVPYVFYDSLDGMRYKNVKRSFKTACKRSGITDFRFHDLRHTFASHLVMAGVDLTTVKELLGHKTLAMTLRYAHLAPAHKVMAVDILDSTLTGQPTIQKLYSPIKKEVAVNA